MDSSTILAFILTCAPLVHPTTAMALIRVESAGNPYAIGVVRGALARQPRSAGEAIATADDLRAKGWNFSVGLAQINVNNFERLGMSTASAFDPCRNLQAMQSVLTECLARAGNGSAPQQDVRRSLSCYYSGNFVTGYRHGYVGRVVAAARDTRGGP